MDHIEQDGLKPDFNLPRFFRNEFNLAISASVLFGLLLLAIGAGQFLFRGSTPNDDIKIIPATSSQVAGQIIVHVDGAVVKPGIYNLSSDSRVNDAVEAAGGFSTGADRSKVNLAAKIADGQKVYVPKVGESMAGTKSITSATGSESSGLVSINSASQSELEGLPAIGPVTAGKIINGRPYSQVDDLLSKKIVGKSTFEKIKELVSL